MKRPADTFVLTPELGERLRGLRLKADLTKLELAKSLPSDPRPKR